MEQRDCKKCHETKPITDFPKTQSSPGYVVVRGTCRECKRAQDREYAAKHQKKRAQTTREWQKANPDKVREYALKYGKKWSELSDEERKKKTEYYRLWYNRVKETDPERYRKIREADNARKRKARERKEK